MSEEQPTIRAIPLRVRSPLSMGLSILTLPQIAKYATNNRVPAIGIMEYGGLHGVFEASDKLTSAGIQPIIGIEMPVRTKRTVASAAVWIKSEDGYRNLVGAMNTLHHMLRDQHRSHDPGQKGALTIPFPEPRLITMQGIIVAQGGPRSLLRQLAGRHIDDAKTLVERYKKRLGDRFYIEITRDGFAEEAQSENALISLAYEFDVPLLATSDIAMVRPADLPAARTLLAIRAGRTVHDTELPHEVTETCVLAPPSDLVERFKDLPEAVINTEVVARRCAFMVEAKKPQLPPPPPHLRYKPAEEILDEKARAGLEEMLTRIDEERHHLYRDRLEMELGAIKTAGFSGYFLTVADFIEHLRSLGNPVGPGRGSAAGSLVCRCMGITTLDPIRHNLLFERFINPERVSLPDIDTDMEAAGREIALDYVRKIFGEQHSARIATFQGLRVKAALGDSAKALALPNGLANDIVNLIPMELLKPTEKDPVLPRAIEASAELKRLYHKDERARQLIDIAAKLEYVVTHISTHAAGVVISENSLFESTPLEKSISSQSLITQFGMKAVEATGLVKYDFLVIDGLSVIERTIEALRAQGHAIDENEIPEDDAATFAFMQHQALTGVFQLEQPGMREALARIGCDSLDDLISLVALYRPGPKDEIPRFAARKHGLEEIESVHALVDDILKVTYGVMVYQEQIIEAVKRLALFSGGRADIVRRAMGKKDPAEAAAQKAGFVDGCQQNGLSKRDAETIWGKIVKFAEYGFNKSHAAAYATVAYRSAHLKCHYYPEFLSSALNVAGLGGDHGKVRRLFEDRLHVMEARDRGQLPNIVIPDLLPPDIFLSDASFTLIRENGRVSIRQGLGTMKTMPFQAAQRWTAIRADFAGRSLPSVLEAMRGCGFSKEHLRTLAMLGCFDRLAESRDDAVDAASRAQQKQDTATGNLLDSIERAPIPRSTKLQEPDPATCIEIMGWMPETPASTRLVLSFNKNHARLAAGQETSDVLPLRILALAMPKSARYPGSAVFLLGHRFIVQDQIPGKVMTSLAEWNEKHPGEPTLMQCKVTRRVGQLRIRPTASVENRRLVTQLLVSVDSEIALPGMKDWLEAHHRPWCQHLRFLPSSVRTDHHSYTKYREPGGIEVIAELNVDGEALRIKLGKQVEIDDDALEALGGLPGISSVSLSQREAPSPYNGRQGRGRQGRGQRPDLHVVDD